MTFDMLLSHLNEQGYGALLQLGTKRISLLDHCIEVEGDLLRVGICEHGRLVDVLIETANEAAACEFYLDHVAAQHLCLLASTNLVTVSRQQNKLGAAGIAVYRKDLPEYLDLEGIQYRLFVQGIDFKRAQMLLGL